MWGSPTVGVPGAAARRRSAARSWRRRNRKLPGGVLLEFMEVPAQRFVMCLCQSETGRAAAGSSRHATPGGAGLPGGIAPSGRPHTTAGSTKDPPAPILLATQAIFSSLVHTISPARAGKLLLHPFLCFRAPLGWGPALGAARPPMGALLRHGSPQPRSSSRAGYFLARWGISSPVGCFPAERGIS